jgi:hypothetical protein
MLSTKKKVVTKRAVREASEEEEEGGPSVAELAEDREESDFKALVVSHAQALNANSIRTKTKPPVYWMPKEHTEHTRKLLGGEGEVVDSSGGEESDTETSPR